MGIRFDKTVKRWRIRWTDERGMDAKHVMPEGSTRDDAEAFWIAEKQKVDAIKRGHAVRERNPDKLTVDDITRKWLDAKKRNERDVLSVKAHVLGSDLGAERIDRVTPARINAFLASLKPSTNAVRPAKGELSAATRNHVRKHLISIFKLAIARGWLVGENPARASEREKVTKKTLVTLTADEAVAVVAAAAFPWNAIIACGLLGLRRGEIWGLNCEDVDTQRWELRVRRSHDRVTKSGRERVVPIHPAFRPLLVNAVQASKHAPLFPGEKGARRSENTKGAREFNAALKAAGIQRRVRFHDLRHTAATMMIQSGATLQHVKDVLGHATIAITSDTYGHLVVDDLRNAVERMPLKMPALVAVKEQGR